MAKLQKLTSLALGSFYPENRKITDAGLKEVAKLQKLTSLKIYGMANTKISDAGVANLQKALPNCKIDTDH